MIIPQAYNFIKLQNSHPIETKRRQFWPLQACDYVYMKYNIHRFDVIISNRRRGHEFLFYQVNKKLVLRVALLVQCVQLG